MTSASADSTPEGSVDTRHDAPGQLTGPVVVVALVSAVSGMLYGYDTGIISGALLQITDDFGIAKGWKQVIAASILLGAVIGALTCSYLSEKRGRKGTLVMLAILFVVGALWCAVAPNPVVLSLGRLVLGFAVGGATQTAPMYVAELAPPKFRGRLVLCFQIAIGVGIVIATIVGASESIDWRVSIGSAAVPAAIMLVLMLRLPESPRWLVKHDDREKARNVLERVRPSGYDVEGELDEMRSWRTSRRRRARGGGPGCARRGCARHWCSAAVSPSSPNSAASK
jgi:MFS family permease